jgi:hypothetical protein
MIDKLTGAAPDKDGFSPTDAAVDIAPRIKKAPEIWISPI